MTGNNAITNASYFLEALENGKAACSKIHRLMISCLRYAKEQS